MNISQLKTIRHLQNTKHANSCAWSSDKVIAVATQTSVHVTELIADFSSDDYGFRPYYIYKCTISDDTLALKSGSKAFVLKNMVTNSISDNNKINRFKVKNRPIYLINPLDNDNNIKKENDNEKTSEFVEQNDDITSEVKPDYGKVTVKVEENSQDITESVKLDCSLKLSKQNNKTPEMVRQYISKKLSEQNSSEIGDNCKLSPLSEQGDDKLSKIMESSHSEIIDEMREKYIKLPDSSEQNNSKSTEPMSINQNSRFYSAISDIGWSSEFTFCNGCMLGILTIGGMLYICIRGECMWKTVIDVTTYFRLTIELLKTKGNFGYNFPLVDTSTITDEDSKIVAFCWFSNLNSGKETTCNLIAGHKNGYITMWEMEQKSYANIKSIGIWNLKLECKIYSLTWHQISDTTGWLLISLTNGVVELFCIAWNRSLYYEVKYLTTLWSDRDLIVPCHIDLFTRKDGSVLYFMAKNNWVIGILLSLDAKIINIHVYQQPVWSTITGLSIIDEDRVFLVTDKGIMCEISIKISDNQLSFTYVNVPFCINNFSVNHSVCGVSFSPNKAMCILLISNADSDSMSLVVCSSYNDAKVPHLMLKQMINKPFHLLHDCFEIFRYMLANNSASNELIYKSDNPFEGDNFGSLTSLQMLFWYTKIKRKLYHNSESEEFFDATEFKIMILIKHIHNNIEAIISKRQKFFVRQFIKSNVDKIPKNFKELRIDAIKMVEHLAGDDYVENCPICFKVYKLEEILTEFSEIHYVKCRRNHRVNRCLYSLLPFEFQGCYYCVQCSSRVSNCQSKPRCIFCDNLMFESGP